MNQQVLIQSVSTNYDYPVVMPSPNDIGSWRDSFGRRFDDQLAEINRLDLRRGHRQLESAQTSRIKVDGKEVLNFCSNDYLGLANHQELREASIDAQSRFGMGSGASHMVIGHHELHQQLCEELARFTQRDKVLLFSSGYMANLAAIATIAGKDDLVLQDKLNHASLIDGALLSGARFQRYLHSDVQSASRYLDRINDKNALIVSDGVFSMDGDVAPLKDLAELSASRNAMMMVDDAHGIGVLGESGKGSVISAGLSQEDVPILVGTFGKAIGTSGAFIAGPDILIDYLTQKARPYIYTTAFPPSVAAATVASIRLIEKADNSRSHLQSLIALFRSEMTGLGYKLLPSNTPIQPVMLGASERALRVSEMLLDQNVLVTAIRPPTVPKNSARLRVTLTAAHTAEDVAELVRAFKSVRDGGGIDVQT